MDRWSSSVEWCNEEYFMVSGETLPQPSAGLVEALKCAHTCDTNQKSIKSNETQPHLIPFWRTGHLGGSGTAKLNLRIYNWSWPSFFFFFIFYFAQQEPYRIAFAELQKYLFTICDKLKHPANKQGSAVSFSTLHRGSSLEQRANGVTLNVFNPPAPSPPQPPPQPPPPPPVCSR